MPTLLGNDEGVAAENDRDVVVPAGESSSLVMVKAEFAFEVLVGALDPPALHYQADPLLCGQLGAGDRNEEVVGRLGLAVAPFDEQGSGLVVGDLDLASNESSCEWSFGSLSPGAATEGALSIEIRCNRLQALWLPNWTAGLAE